MSSPLNTPGGQFWVGARTSVLSDAVGISGNIATAVGYSRAATDSVGITDTLTKAQGFAQSYSGSLGLTDSGTFIKTTAPSFAALGSSAFSGGGVASGSSTITAPAGSTVLAFFTVYAGTVASVTCGGTAMTQVAAVTNPLGATSFCYKLQNVSGGTMTTVVTANGTFNIGGNTIAFTGVTTVGAGQTQTYSSVTSGSQTVTCTSSQLAVQFFEDFDLSALISVTGGTSRWKVGTMAINTNSPTTTFTANLSSSDSFASIATVLS